MVLSLTPSPINSSPPNGKPALEQGCGVVARGRTIVFTMGATGPLFFRATPHPIA